MSVFEVTLLMGAFVLGGTLSQWPIGRLSDDHDRRIVILPVTLATVATGLTIASSGELDLIPMLALAVLHGALMIPIYSLCIAHVNDSAPSDRFVQVSGGLLLIYSAGAALGPLAAAPLMDHYGPGGLFMFLSGALALFAIVVIFRIIVARRRIRAFPDRYALVTKTTQSIYEMEEPDPPGEPE
jgi:MFS family permease